MRAWTQMKNIWLDCDPGHDDATAILNAIHAPGVRLLGVSTVHGNTDATFTAFNAARCMVAFGAPEDIRVHAGISKPLIRPVKHDPEIHGVDGLGGVQGLPDAQNPEVLLRLAEARALEALPSKIRQVWRNGEGEKVYIISSGPLTNIALFVSAYPDLLEAVEEIVMMGGGVGMGNRSAVAEFNILVDPEAAQIVLNAPVKKTLIPINVTHRAIVTPTMHARILSGSRSAELLANSSLPSPTTPLRYTLSTVISFFAESYRTTFGFVNGPPLHDALTVAYVAHPEMFTVERHRVDVELHGTHTFGETVVDLFKYRSCDDSWGPQGRNCQVATSVDVPNFFEFLLDCIDRCDRVSPLNHGRN